MRKAGDSLYETEMQYKLKDIPEIITISNKHFVIVGAIVFIPPIVDGDVGHYICADKVNNQWEIYDDLDSKSPKNKSSQANVIIHALMYVISEKN